jgi:hypothetical protein
MNYRKHTILFDPLSSMSLSAFVSGFEDGKSYDETHHVGLGLDLLPEIPLLH